MAWDLDTIQEECESNASIALCKNKAVLDSYNQDFGHLFKTQVACVYKPENISQLQSIIRFVNSKKLPVTIRGAGQSQCGQSLPREGGLSLDMQSFSKVMDFEKNAIWVEAGATWHQVIDCTLKRGLRPYVIPSNCHLTVGGTLSAGGVGPSSFLYGHVGANIEALEVLTADGKLSIATKESPLFQACIGGQGRYGIITKVCLKLVNCTRHVRTFMLLYDNQSQWLDDLFSIENNIDYFTAFCSPCIQGMKLVGGKRVPFAHWLYGMHISIEFDEDPKELSDCLPDLKYTKMVHVQEESLASYLSRNDSRFQAMKLTGQWELAHPWYECFFSNNVAEKYLQEMLDNLPLSFANFIEILPIKKRSAGFFMLPEDDKILGMAILNPGIHEALKQQCFQAIEYLDQLLLPKGSKRYLSGFLGNNLDKQYWEKHFAQRYNDWRHLKQEYDPNGIFSSLLHP